MPHGTSDQLGQSPRQSGGNLGPSEKRGGVACRRRHHDLQHVVPPGRPAGQVREVNRESANRLGSASPGIERIGREAGRRDRRHSERWDLFRHARFSTRSLGSRADSVVDGDRFDATFDRNRLRTAADRNRLGQVSRFFFAHGLGWLGRRRRPSRRRDHANGLRSHPLHRVCQTVEIFQARQSHDRHLGKHRRMATRPHAAERMVDDLQHGQQRDGAGLAANRSQINAESVPLQHQFGAAADACQQAVAQGRHHLLQHSAWISTAGGRRIKRRERTGGIPRRQARDDRADFFLAAGADHRVHLVYPDRPVSRSEELFQERLAVSHAPGRAAGDQCQRVRSDLGPLRLDDLSEAAADRRRIDGVKVEPLASGENRDRQFVRLGRAEHELHMGRRLLERLEECVERLPREHVHFVDDVGFVVAPRGPDGDVLPQLAHLVDAAIAGGVDLHHVDILPGRDRRAAVADVAGLAADPAGAFKRLGIDAGGARLAHAAGAGEKIGMADPARLDRPRQASGDVFLADEFIEPLWPVAAGHHLIANRRGDGRARVGGWFALSSALLYRWFHR